MQLRASQRLLCRAGAALGMQAFFLLRPVKSYLWRPRCYSCTGKLHPAREKKTVLRLGSVLFPVGTALQWGSFDDRGTLQRFVCGQDRKRTVIFWNTWTKQQKSQSGYHSASKLEIQTNPPWFNADSAVTSTPFCKCSAHVWEALCNSLCRCRDFSNCLMTLRQPCPFVCLLTVPAPVFLGLALGSCPLLGFRC